MCLIHHLLYFYQFNVGIMIVGLIKSEQYYYVKHTQSKRCGPCLLMAPEFELAAKDLSGKVRFVKLDTDLEPDMVCI